MPVLKRRSAPWSVPAASTACCGELDDAVGRPKPEREARALEPLDVQPEEDGAAAADAHRLERGGAAQQRLVVGMEDGLGRVDETLAGDRGGQEIRHAGTSPPTARSRGRALTHDSSISASGSESQTMPAADPEVDAAFGDGERADRQRQLEVAVGANRAERAHRRRRDRPARAPAIRSTAAIFGAPVTEPPGKVAARISPRPHVGSDRPLDRGDEVRDARELALRHQLGPGRPSPARRRARGRSARGRRSSRARRRPSRPRRRRRRAASP